MTKATARWARGLVAWLGLVGTSAASGLPPVARSLVRLVNYSQRGDWANPWDVSRVRPAQGSGFVIEGGLVMTNAHVVSDTRMLLLFLPDDPQPHPAEVFRIAHDCDLALVRPKQAGLLDGLPALAIGGPPGLGTQVETFGFALGDRVISSTRGIVSRISEQTYVHPGIHNHFVIQTDAAINPGASGGPVLQDGKVVGVAFQARPDLQSVGYCIPPEVVVRFLADVADGRYDGFPDLGVSTAELVNPAARKAAGMEDDETGVRVDFVQPGSSAAGVLRLDDVLLAIDGRPIANDETVSEQGQRFDYQLLVDRRQVGESVTLRVLRGGVRSEVAIPLKALPGIEWRGNVYDRRPRYLVYGGLVFVPLEWETIRLASSDRLLLHEYAFRPQAEPRLLSKERVVLLKRLEHPVNIQMNWFRYQVVERVNGEPVESLEELVEALEGNAGRYQVFEFAHFRRVEVLDREAAEAANPEILERHGIVADRNL